MQNAITTNDEYPRTTLNQGCLMVNPTRSRTRTPGRDWYMIQSNGSHRSEVLLTANRKENATISSGNHAHKISNNTATVDTISEDSNLVARIRWNGYTKT